MNVYMLVEGRRTEVAVYSSWLKEAFPRLRRVYSVDELTGDALYIVAGHGYPQTLPRIRQTLEDVCAHEGRIDDYAVCIDADEDGLDVRTALLRDTIGSITADLDLFRKHPELRIHVIVQNCCIETWFLGHRKLFKRNPESAALRGLIDYHDVRLQDPEAMGCPTGTDASAARFHLRYLKLVMEERGLRYTKDHPGIVLERSYLDALRERRAETGHLASMAPLLQLLGLA